MGAPDVIDMHGSCPAGVHGRVTDLAQVAQRQYNVAMAMVMGKDMDSVVVDNQKTAQQCIEYLKEQQVPPMTFIPVATIVAKPVNDRLRAMGGSSKLALDLLTYPPAFERAFISICQCAPAPMSFDDDTSMGYMQPLRMGLEDCPAFCALGP